MVYFGVVASKKAKRYFRFLRDNFRHPKGAMEVLFNGHVSFYGDNYLVSVEPRLPKFYLYGLVLIPVSVVFNATVENNLFTWLFATPGAVMLLTYVFWRPETYYLLIKLALYKNDGDGCRLVSGEKLYEALEVWERTRL